MAEGRPTLLYTLPGCAGCGAARALLTARGEAFEELALTDPLREMGARALWKDGALRAPIILRPGLGAYTTTSDDPPRLVRMLPPESGPRPADLITEGAHA